MNRIDETTIAEALLTAPGWARVGLTAPTSWMREDAARELARAVLGQAAKSAALQGEQEQLPL
jgi:hypothetical protein